MRWPVALLVTLTFVLGGVAAAAAPAPEAAGNGCGIGRAPGTKVHTVSSGGRDRSYRLTVPRGYTGDERVPLVVDLHGAGSNAFEEQLLTSADDEAAEHEGEHHEEGDRPAHHGDRSLHEKGWIGTVGSQLRSIVCKSEQENP
jgi:poly(3-hydroxybutyrate) depolymerase